MPTRQVTIQGVMTWDDPGVNVPVFPTHPIAPGGPPPGIWPGPGRPDQGLPGQPPGIWTRPGNPAHPIYHPPGVNVPVFPTHPIVPGGLPPGIWGGGGEGFPTPPIFLPPDQ